MKHKLTFLLLFMASSTLAQKVNYQMAVNSSGTMTNAVSLVPTTYAAVDYSTLGIGVGCGIVAVNIKNSFQDILIDITQYVADKYLSGGKPSDRFKMAAEGTAQIARLEKKIIVAGQDVSWWLNEPFAQDLILFKQINDQQAAPIFIQDSPDQAIPFRVVTNYPLLLANGQKQPTVISNAKSILIK